MKRAIWLGILPMAFAGAGLASSCGTFASPTGCNITVGGTNTYTISGFTVNSSNLYQGGDIDIDISTGGGQSLLMTFSKHSGSPTPGVVFFANPGENFNFTISYVVTLSAAAAGTVAFTTPSIAAFTQSSALGGGFSQDQMILNDGVNGVSCAALRTSGGVSQGTCNALPANTQLFLNVSNILSLSGGTTGSNTSFLGFSNLLNSTFAPDTSGGAVPEPSTYALMGLGLAAAGLRRRFRS